MAIGPRALGALLPALAAGCVHGPAEVPVAPGGREPVRAVPLSTCRSIGAWGNPCFPTPSEIGGRAVDPCYSRRWGHCGGTGQGMCYLEPIAEGKRCSTGQGICSGGRCTPG